MIDEIRRPHARGPDESARARRVRGPVATFFGEEPLAG
jgi:hypothetical protein